MNFIGRLLERIRCRFQDIRFWFKRHWFGYWNMMLVLKRKNWEFWKLLKTMFYLMLDPFQNIPLITEMANLEIYFVPLLTWQEEPNNNSFMRLLNIELLCDIWCGNSIWLLLFYLFCCIKNINSEMKINVYLKL